MHSDLQNLSGSTRKKLPLESFALEESGTEKHTCVYRRMGLRNCGRKRKQTPASAAGAGEGAGPARRRQLTGRGDPLPAAHRGLWPDNSGRELQRRGRSSCYSPACPAALRAACPSRGPRRAPSSRISSAAASRSARNLGAADGSQAPSSPARRPFRSRASRPGSDPSQREERAGRPRTQLSGLPSPKAPRDPGRNQAPVPFDLILWRYNIDIKR